MKSRRRFSLCFKLKVINSFERILNYSQVATIFNVTRMHVRVWVRRKEQFSKISSKTKRSYSGYKRPASHVNLEVELTNWIKETRESGVSVFGKIDSNKSLRNKPKKWKF